VADIRVNFATSSRIIFGFLCFSIYVFLFLQDYTEALELQSKTRFLDLFQRRYAHSLTVSLARNENKIIFRHRTSFFQNMSNLSTVSLKRLELD
jgi:hypothetical protein